MHNLDIDWLRQNIPAFTFGTPTVFANLDARWQCYFKHYGFDTQITTACDYHMGSMAICDWQLTAHYWALPESKATVFLVHGLFDHVGLYLKLVSHLLERDFAVLAVDMPGHGLSAGSIDSITHFSQYAQIVHQCLSCFSSQVTGSIHAVGQSTGGAALLAYLLDQDKVSLIERAVLMAPLIRPKGWGMIRFFYTCMHFCLKHVKRKFTCNSHDGAFVDFLKHADPLQSKYISVVWVGAVREWINTFENFPKSDTRLLVLQGTGDMTVDWKNNISLIQAKFSACQTVAIDNAMHHMVNEAEPWRSEIFTYASDFLDSGESITGPLQGKSEST